MKRDWLRWMVLATLSAVGAAAIAADGNGAGASNDLEKRIEDARRQLDEAARTLAELKAEQLKSSLPAGHPNRASLGVVLLPSEAEGLVIAGVTPGGGAAQAGLRPGDVIVSIDGVAVDQSEAPGTPKMLNLLGEVEPGETVRVEYERDAERVSIDVVTQAHPALTMAMGSAAMGIAEPPSIDFFETPVPPDAQFPPDAPAPHTVARAQMFFAAQAAASRLELRDLNEKLGRYFGASEGVLVLSAPEEEAGLEPGDVIRAIAGTPIATAQEGYRALFSTKDEVGVEVLRDGGIVTVQAKPLAGGSAGTFVPGDGLRDVRVIRSVRGKGDGAEGDVNVDVIVRRE